MNKLDAPTFGRLWKKQMNETPLPQNAPLVGTPRTASGDLLRQATRQVVRNGQNRKKILGQLATSTARKPAAVTAPAPAAATTTSGFGGAGYSGNNAAVLGAPSNPGTVTAPTRPPTTYFTA